MKATYLVLMAAFCVLSAQAAKTCVGTDSGVFKLDTRSIHVMEGAPLMVTYSGDLWGAAGAGETAEFLTKRGTEAAKTVVSGLADAGTYAWHPEGKGVYVITLRSGTATLTATFDVSRVTGMILLFR